MSTPTTSNTILDTITQLVDHPLVVITVAAAAIAAAFFINFLQYRRNKARMRAEDRFRLQAFPFLSDTSEDLSQLEDDLIGPTATIQYAQRVPVANFIQKTILSNNRVLLIGRTGIGKTRESIEAIKSLAKQEADPVTVFRPKGYIGRPMSMEALVEFSKRPILLIDDIDTYYALDESRINEILGADDLHDRFVNTVKWFSAQSPRLHVICTAQDDSFISTLDPEKQYFWDTFTIIHLPEIHNTALKPFIRQLAKQCALEVNEDAISYIVRKCDATYKGLIDAFYRRMKENDQVPNKLTLDDVRQMRFTWPIDWDTEVFDAEIKGKPISRLVFEALGVVEHLSIPPYKRIVVDLASRMYRRFLFIFVRKRVVNAINVDLKRWMGISLGGRVICQSAYLKGKGDVNRAYSLLESTIRALPFLEKQRLLPDIYQITQQMMQVTGEHSIALRFAKLFEKKLPENIPTLYSLRNIYLDQKDYANAIRKSERLVQLAPGAVSFYLHSAACGLSANDAGEKSEKLLLHKKAINLAKQGAAFDSSFPPILQSLSINYGEIGEFTEAVAAAKQLTQIRGISKDWYTLSVAHGKSGDFENATIAARRAVSLSPKSIRARKSLIRNMNMQPQISVEERVREIEELAKLASEKEDWVAMSIAFGKAAEVAKTEDLKRDLHTRAIVEAKKAIELDDRCVDAMRSLRMNYGNLSSSEESIYWGTKLLQICESSDDWYGLGVAYGKMGKFSKAQNAARRATELDPQNEEAWRSLVINSSGANDKASEVAALERMTSLFGKADDWQQLSVVKGKMGRYSESESAARKAIKIDPEHEMATKALFQALLGQGKFKEAEKYMVSGQNVTSLVFRQVDKLLEKELNRAVVELLQARIAEDPNNHDYWQVLGASLRKLGVELREDKDDARSTNFYFEEALAAHEKALALISDEANIYQLAPIWYAKGRAYLELEDLGNACRCFQEATRLNPSHLAADRYLREYCQFD